MVFWQLFMQLSISHLKYEKEFLDGTTQLLFCIILFQPWINLKYLENLYFRVAI